MKIMELTQRQIDAALQMADVRKQAHAIIGHAMAARPLLEATQAELQATGKRLEPGHRRGAQAAMKVADGWHPAMSQAEVAARVNAGAMSSRKHRRALCKGKTFVNPRPAPNPPNFAVLPPEMIAAGLGSKFTD